MKKKGAKGGGEKWVTILWSSKKNGMEREERQKGPKRQKGLQDEPKSRACSFVELVSTYY